MQPEEITSRAATAADEEFRQQMFYIVRAPEFQAAGMTPPVLEEFLAQQYRAMRTHYEREFPGTAYMVFEHDGQPVGYEAVHVAEEIHLIDIALKPEYRNQGIGAHRMRHLQALARDCGKSVILSVEVFNPAKRLYERMGFSVIAEAGIYQRMRWAPPERVAQD
ncbi:MAG: GNAT family N-acetyltransferase [Fimbriimonadaceae bacterium]